MSGLEWDGRLTAQLDLSIVPDATAASNAISAEIFMLTNSVRRNV